MFTISFLQCSENKAIPYAYGQPIRVWAAHISIRIWDRPIRVWAKIRVRDGTEKHLFKDFKMKLPGFARTRPLLFSGTILSNLLNKI